MELPMKTTLVFLILKIVFSILCAAGTFFMFLEIFGFPSGSVKKNTLFLTKKATTKQDSLDLIINQISNFISRFVKIGEFKRKRIETQLNILEIKETPEEYYARIITKTLLLALFIPFGFLVHWTLGVLLVFFTSIVCLLQVNELSSVMQKRKESIESELPKFVSIIEQTFKNDHDVIKLITNYTDDSDSFLSREMKIALADMKTGDFETALNRLTNRVNSVYLSETVRGLQSALRGNDTTGYFNTLSVKLWDNEKHRIKKNALKIPSRVKYLVGVLLISMFGIYVCVFGTVIADNLSQIMGM